MANISIKGNTFRDNASVFGSKSKQVAILTQRLSADNSAEVFVDCFETMERAENYLSRRHDTLQKLQTTETMREYRAIGRDGFIIFFVRETTVR